jgi:hypothetical protein
MRLLRHNTPRNDVQATFETAPCLLISRSRDRSTGVLRQQTTSEYLPYSFFVHSAVTKNVSIPPSSRSMLRYPKRVGDYSLPTE